MCDSWQCDHAENTHGYLSLFGAFTEHLPDVLFNTHISILTYKLHVIQTNMSSFFQFTKHEWGRLLRGEAFKRTFTYQYFTDKYWTINWQTKNRHWP